MFYVSIKTSKTDSRVFYKCPECSVQSVYFVLIPEVCNNCGCLLPSPEKMEKSQLARYNYHICKR